MFLIKDITINDNTMYYIGFDDENEIKHNLLAKFVSIFVPNINKNELNNKTIANMVSMDEYEYINKMIEFKAQKLENDIILFMNRKHAMDAVSFLNKLLLKRKLSN